MKRGTILKGVVWRRFLRVVRILLKKGRFGKIKVAFVLFTCYRYKSKSFEFLSKSLLAQVFLFIIEHLAKS